MDKIEKYRKIIEDILRQRAATSLANVRGAEPHLVIDKEKDEFILLWVGWTGNHYKHGIMFHLQIKDKKIWIHEDRTDFDIAGRLVDAGIPKSDIVLGFVEPLIRETAGFAIA
jgi:hypothetical protein